MMTTMMITTSSAGRASFLLRAVHFTCTPNVLYLVLVLIEVELNVMVVKTDGEDFSSRKQSVILVTVFEREVQNPLILIVLLFWS